MRPGHSKLLTFAVVLLVLSTAGAATVGTVSTATAHEATTPQSATDRGPIQTTQSDGVSPPRLLAQQDDALFQTDIDADLVEMEATLDADGNADWRVVYRLELDDDDAVAGFENLSAEIAQNASAYLDPFEERLRLTAETARESTGRETRVGNFTVSAEETVQPDTRFGDVTFTFDWESFAAVRDDGTLEVGDALDSLFLDERTSLTLRWGEFATLESHRPDADTVDPQRIAWRGPRDFDRGQPRAVLAPADESPAGGDDSATGDDGTGTDTGPADDGTGTQDGENADAGSGSFPILPAILVVSLLAVVGAVLGVVVRRDAASSDGTAHVPETDVATDQTEDGDADAETPPADLLSNEEQILKLVDEQGGRMKQKQVAERLDWSAARTSQVVGNLREEDRIETFRIGRENVLTLPDVDIVSDTDRADGANDTPAGDDDDETPGS
jgi:hypothetical protein